MDTRTVRIGTRDYDVEVAQLQASFWRASGTVKRERVQATGKNEAQALRNWTRAAEVVVGKPKA